MIRALLFGLALFIAANASQAANIAMLDDRHGISITLTDEHCSIPAIDPQYYRATWEEHGKTTEGCWSVNGLRIVVLYFVDKTLAAMPVGMFKKLEEL